MNRAAFTLGPANSRRCARGTPAGSKWELPAMLLHCSLITLLGSG